jgi:hypothetical protein
LDFDGGIGTSVALSSHSLLSAARNAAVASSMAFSL